MPLALSPPLTQTAAPARSFLSIFTWMTLFSVAMAMLESAVVVYLRALLYGNADLFPLQEINATLATTELLREIATIVMLIGAGWLAGHNRAERFGWFLFAFAVWDIYYYAFLWVLIDWPTSLMGWDVLFLIPVTWVGPVITPVLLAGLMILLGMLIMHFSWKGLRVRLGAAVWSILILGAITCIVAFCWDYTAYVLEQHPEASIWSLPSEQGLWDLTNDYYPRSFPWWLYWIGFSIISSGIGLFYFKHQRQLATG